MREVKVLKHLPVLVLTLLWAAGTTLWLLFVQEQQEHLRTGFQSQLERLSDELLRGRLEGRLGPDALPEGVRAFALYNPKGEQIGSWGHGAPDRLAAADSDRPVTTVQEGGEWIRFVKVLLPLRPRMELWGDERGPRGTPPGAGRRGQGFVYLSASSAPLEGRVWAWTLGGGIGAAAWAGFVAFVGILWFRTRRFQETLNQHRELLQFAEASRTLSHELQNPLAAILLQTALLKRSAGGKPAAEVILIEEEAHRMSALVARVRDFLKDPRGQAEIVDLAEVAESMKDRFALPILLEHDPVPFPVHFDRHRLRSVVENLIKNAVESGPRPQPVVRLARPRSGWVRLEVLDSGGGFTPESLKQARQPFFTTKTTGTGIGLSIADGFVRAAGGRLRLENRSEGGARVVLDLPEAGTQA